MSKIAIKSWGIISEIGNTEEAVLKNWDEKNILQGGNIDFQHKLDPKRIRRMGRLAKMATSVSEQCLSMGNIEEGDNTGIIMNTDYGSINLNLEFGEVLKTPDLASPMDFANTVSNAALGHVAVYFNLKGSSTLLMGSNGISYTMRQLEKDNNQKIIYCGGDEFCAPISNYAQKKFGKQVVSEGVAAILLESGTDSEWGYIIGDAQSGIGYSPLYGENRDVSCNYEKMIRNALEKAKIDSNEIDLVMLSGDAGSGIREYEKKAVERVFDNRIEKRFLKDQIGECFGGSVVSSVVIGSILLKNKRYDKILVLGTEVSGTIEAFILSR